MANAQTSTDARYPKRKRTQINYYEEDLELVNVIGSEGAQDGEDHSQQKKRKATAPRPLPKRRIFPFLQLPAEIRNMIYGLCLTDPAGIYLHSTTKKFRRTVCRVPEVDVRGQAYTPVHDGNSNSEDNENENEISQQPKPSEYVQPLVPALLAVCKQIHLEARDVLYAHDFYMHDTLAMHSFLVDLGARAAAYLKSVTLAEWGVGRGVHKAYNHAGFTALAAATNLEKFTFHGFLSWRQDSKAGATSFYRDAFPWLEAVGAARKKADAAVDLIEIHVSDVGYRYYGRMYGRQKQSFKPYDDMEGFRKELGKLLDGRMDMIRS
ncbi:hypothetical protein N0V90_010451 [Kalmusia sp. IMI 367209]|nr:hypothetical protein N0V90_010451 [Kalmusia sp. IMI 367209]